jgi:predicted signal transduction protein with EAL and GGDEF domain
LFPGGITNALPFPDHAYDAQAGDEEPSMSSTVHGANVANADDTADLTRCLRSITSPPADVAAGLGGKNQDIGKVILLCRDGTCLKWGPRWLREAGLEPIVPQDPLAGLEAARLSHPALIVVDTSLRDRTGVPLYQQLRATQDLDCPVLALCPNGKELAAALAAGFQDVVRKPFDWQLIARRARGIAARTQLERDLRDTRASLRQALDVAERARTQLRNTESFDPVTGLPNRKKFFELVGRGMGAADRDGNTLAVMVVGFNRFRLVAEALGPESADRVLGEIGRTLNECLGRVSASQQPMRGLRTAASASLESARFGIMLTTSGDDSELIGLMQMVVGKLSRPVQLAGQTVYLSPSVGIALYPRDARNEHSLLQRAENAMRDARRRGGGFKFHSADSDAAAARKLELEHMLHQALERNELRLAYQPITDTHTGRVTGAEALLRWPQAGADCISPAEFVPVAEESGLITRIGEFVLDEACAQLKRWRDQGIDLPLVCVNASKVQLMSSDFVALVENTLRRHGLRPDSLELELSERGVLSGDYEVISQLRALKRLGVRLSIDDFGTGDSAIAYLRELPADVLKIDRSYVAGLTRSDKDAAIVSAIVALGQRLQLKIIAEGVETAEQLEALQSIDCEEYQGFLKSRPVYPQDFARLLKHT